MSADLNTGHRPSTALQRVAPDASLGGMPTDRVPSALGSRAASKTMKRTKSLRHALITAGSLLLTALVVPSGCSSGEDVGTCFFRCDQEGTGVSLYGCKPTTKPNDDCAAVANEFCLTLGTTTGRHQFESDCIVDCQSATSCASCAPSWHGKMCVEEDDAGEASDGDTTDASDDVLSEDVEASADAAEDAAADDASAD